MRGSIQYSKSVGAYKIYRGAFNNNQFAIEEGYEINNRFFDELSIWERNNQLYFINSSGYFRLDKDTDRIVVDKELAEELGIPHHHLHNEQGRVWIFNGKIWILLLPDGNTQKFTYLGVYPDLKYISFDEQMSRYWLVTQDNQLLAYVDNEIFLLFGGLDADGTTLGDTWLLDIKETQRP